MHKNRWHLTILVLVLLMLVPLGLTSAQGPVGLDFTYQGYITGDDLPLSGTCDFQFTLWDDAAAGSQVGPLVEQLAVPVGSGRFTTRLDFGNVYDGTALWLQVAVRCGDPDYTTLTPRQALTAAPYAASTLALRGQPLSGAAPAAGQVLEWDGANWTAAADDDTTYTAEAGIVLSGTVFSADETYLQRRVAPCGAGYAIQQVNQDGTVVCQLVDNTTYTAEAGIILSGTVFSADETYLQRRVAPCGAGYAIQQINQDGSVVCQVVDNTTYTAGPGLDLAGNQFSILASFRLPQSCAAGEIPEWNVGLGVWECGADDNTTYTAGLGLALVGNQFILQAAYRLPQGCAAGEIPEWNVGLGTWECGADDNTTYTNGMGLDLLGNQFSILASYRLPQTCAAGEGAAWNGATWDCAAYSVPGHNHWGETWSGAGVGLTLNSADGTGLSGSSAGPAGRGLYGLASSAAGTASGVYGESASTAGRGVVGWTTAVTGTTYGVYGRNDSTLGYAVYAYAYRGSAVRAIVQTAQIGYDNTAVYASTPGEYGVRATANGTGVYGNGTLHGVYGLAQGQGVYGQGGTGVYGVGNSTGVYGTANSTGVYGYATTTTGMNYGLYGQTDSVTGRGVYGYAPATTGVNYGVYGQTGSETGRGVYGYAPTATGVNYGVYGQTGSETGRGVYGYATAVAGINYGVLGRSASIEGHGVYGYAAATAGVNYGVLGRSVSPTGRGVYGYAEATTGVNYGVFGRSASPSGYAGWFEGNVHVNGTLTAVTKLFRIDDPRDPANSYLNHFSVESSEMRTMYDGVATLGADGAAWVEMPDWFELINKDFCYQLTPIGGAAPGLYIAQEMAGNRFQIAGGPAGLKVSWTVTGTRADPWAEQHRLPVEQAKPAGERGTYLHPELYGQPPELGLGYQPAPADLEIPDAVPGMQP